MAHCVIVCRLCCLQAHNYSAKMSARAASLSAQLKEKPGENAVGSELVEFHFSLSLIFYNKETASTNSQ